MDDTRSIRVMLVSHHTLIRTALARLIADRPTCTVVGEAGTRVQALAQASQHAPDVILLDPHPDSDLWLDAIGPLTKAAGPQSHVLLVTGRPTDHDFHRQALRNGARGILDLDHPPETMFRAIERVHDGDVWMERRLVAELLTSEPDGPGAEWARIDLLTPREREVVKLASQGLRNKQIAERMSVADVTVRHHLTSIYAKLQVADRLSLVVFAFHHGIADPR